MCKFTYKGVEYPGFFKIPYNIKEYFVLEERNINKDENIVNTDSVISKLIRVRKINTNNQTVKFTKYDVDLIRVWLFSKKYESLIIGKYSYNAIFIPSNDIWTDGSELGYIDFTLLLKKKAYTTKAAINLTVVNNEKNVTINNKGSYETFVELNISNCNMRGINGSANISIENKNISGNKINFNNLDEEQHIYCNGLNEYIKSSAKKKINKSGEFVKLKRGENNLLIKGDGICKITISYTPEFNTEEVWNIE